jgi:hypothetical protein
MRGGVHRMRTLGILLAWLGPLVAAPASAEVVKLAPSQDTTLYSEDGNRSNGAGEFVFSGATSRSDVRRALLAFDIAKHVPAGSTIRSVILSLHVSQSPGLAKGPARAQPFVLRRLTASWGEGASNAGPPGGFGATAAPDDATWTDRFWKARAWATPGGDFDPAVVATTVVPVTGDAFVTLGSTAAMVANVQGWLDAPVTNFGWILIGSETAERTARRFDSRENRNEAYRPMLTIEFVPRAGGASR